MYTAAPGRLIAEPIESSEISAGGIHLPETSKEKPQQAIVIQYTPSVEEQKRMHATIPAPAPLCKAGDRIIHSRYGGQPVDIDGRKAIILREEDVLAIAPAGQWETASA